MQQGEKLAEQSQSVLNNLITKESIPQSFVNKTLEPFFDSLGVHNRVKSAPVKALLYDTMNAVKDPSASLGSIIEKQNTLREFIAAGNKIGSQDKNIVSKFADKLNQGINEAARKNKAFRHLDTTSKDLSRRAQDISQQINKMQGNKKWLETADHSLKDWWDRKQNLWPYAKKGSKHSPIIEKLYHALDRGIVKAGKVNPRFSKLYNRANNLTKGRIKSSPAQALLEGTTETNFGKNIVPGVTFAGIIGNVFRGRPIAALRSLIGGTLIGEGIKHGINPLRAANILYKASPEIREIFKSNLWKEARSNPEVATRLISKFGK